MSDEIPKIPTGACPICGKAAATRHRPFCSHRCALIDLGRWLGGNYRVPTKEDNAEDEHQRPGEEEEG
jgi:endogenous inhibitor of DNA gyrase (YacG/DUF329 family)